MPFYYCDASAVVKYFHRESGSAWIRQVVDAREAQHAPRSNQIYLSDVSLAEVPAAFAILARNKHISVRVRDELYDAFLNSIGDEFKPLSLTTGLAYTAGELTQKHPLKGCDAVQLATALALYELLKPEGLDLIFISSDDKLLQAAQSEGLATDNPFAHADLDAPSK